MTQWVSVENFQFQSLMKTWFRDREKNAFKLISSEYHKEMIIA